MKSALVIYNKMTALDFIGFYDPYTRLKSMHFIEDFSWDVCSYTKTVHDDRGMLFTPTKIKKPLDNYDLIYVPGGYGMYDLITNKSFLNWIKTGENCKYKISACTGSLILGAAGFINGKKATTHHLEYNRLEHYNATISKERIVDEGDIITAGGVSAAIDLGLYMVKKLAGEDAYWEIKKQMEYNG